MHPNSELPPPGVVAAAEKDYHAACDELDRLIHAVEHLLAAGHSEIDTVIDTWITLKTQQSKPITLVVCAAAIVRLAQPSKPTPK